MKDKLMLYPIAQFGKYFLRLLVLLVALQVLPVMAVEPFKIEIVDVVRRQFKPSIHEQAKILFRLNRDGQVLVKIYDRRAFQVREFAIEYIEANKVITVAWNGKDDQQRLVPDEAYFFTIEATDIKGNRAEYDPTVSMRTRFTPMQVNYDPAAQKLSFTTDVDAVVDIRAGVANGGPLLAKLIEWKPYMQGVHEIAWDGWDAQHVIQITAIQGYQLYAQMTPLPGYSLFTVGYPDGNDQIYSLAFARDELKRKLETDFSDQLFSQLDASPYKNLTPVFNFEFSGVLSTADNLPVLGNEAGITIRLQESVKQRVTETRYEILVFVDYKFLTEIEEGRSPARVNIDTSKLAVGDHVLTVNLVTLQGGLAALSKRFMKTE
jgi:hypothetical protein